MFRPLAFSAVCVALILLAVAMALGGCRSVPKPNSAPRTDAAAILSDGAAKDASIGTEARAIVAAPADPALVSAAASRILDVLRLSPWTKTEATIRALVGERDAAISAAKTQGQADAKIISDLRAQLDKANSRTDQIIRLGLAAAGAACIGLGILSAFLAAKVAALFPGIGPRISVGIAAIGAGFLFCSFAYGWALRHQTLVMSVFACAAVAVAALFYANRHHAATPQQKDEGRA